MKKVIITSFILVMVASTAWALESVDGQKLNGPHETLNIIGVQNPKTADMDSDTGKGSVIFVNLNGKSKIGLVESGSADAPGVPADEFAVLDKNGTDADGALFALPDPDLEAYVIGSDTSGVDTLSAYSIYVRPLGKPLGYATITTCADVIDSGLASFLSAADVKILNSACDFGGYASIEQVGATVTFRNKGKTTFTNVTAELLTIVLQVQILDETGAVLDTVLVRVPIFDDMLENEYWQYDNNGLKLLQVRIYPWSTDVTYADTKF